MIIKLNGKEYKLVDESDSPTLCGGCAFNGDDDSCNDPITDGCLQHANSVWEEVKNER